MRKLLMIMAAGLIVAAGQAEATQAPVRASDRAAPKAGANQLNGIGLIPTLIISIGVAAWLIKEAGDSTDRSVSP